MLQYKHLIKWRFINFKHFSNCNRFHESKWMEKLVLTPMAPDRWIPPRYWVTAKWHFGNSCSSRWRRIIRFLVLWLMVTAPNDFPCIDTIIQQASHRITFNGTCNGISFNVTVINFCWVARTLSLIIRENKSENYFYFNEVMGLVMHVHTKIQPHVLKVRDELNERWMTAI